MKAKWIQFAAWSRTKETKYTLISFLLFYKNFQPNLSSSKLLFRHFPWLLSYLWPDSKPFGTCSAHYTHLKLRGRYRLSQNPTTCGNRSDDRVFVQLLRCTKWHFSHSLKTILPARSHTSPQCSASWSFSP